MTVSSSVLQYLLLVHVYLFVFAAETMSTATSPILLKWDPKSLEIRTLTVERLLEPLVTQVGLSPLIFLNSAFFM